MELVIGGKKVDSLAIKTLKDNLKAYNLESAKLIIKEGFSVSNVIDKNTINSKSRVLEEYPNKISEEENFKRKIKLCFKKLKSYFQRLHLLL